MSANAQSLIPTEASLADLASAVQGCRACELWESATQAVFGEGAEHPAVVLVDEQPGDVEDRRGRPFVGPAGTLLRSCLAEAGLEEDELWLTNAVKHFRWGPSPGGRGKRRIHRRPDLVHVHACAPWLEGELSRLSSRVTVALGATAAQALLGPDIRVTRDRGTIRPSAHGAVLATRRGAMRAQFIADPSVVARHIHDAA